MYCMPETGTRIRLLIPEQDEQQAIGIQCIRENGGSCEAVQNSNNRIFASNHQKQLELQPANLQLHSKLDDSGIILSDCGTASVQSKKNISIQADGNLMLNGHKVVLQAPKEITAVRRNAGSPTVFNLCNHVDSMGGYTSFKSPRQKVKGPLAGQSSGHQGAERELTTSESERLKEEQTKRLFQLKALTEQTVYTYELGPAIMNVLAAIPQMTEPDELSRIAVGFRPIIGQVKGEG